MKLSLATVFAVNSMALYVSGCAAPVSNSPHAESVTVPCGSLDAAIYAYPDVAEGQVAATIDDTPADVTWADAEVGYVTASVACAAPKVVTFTWSEP